MAQISINSPINQLAYLRVRAGLTQQALANKAGLNIRQVQKFEGGEREIGGMSLRVAAALADALGIQDLRELL